MFPFTSAFIKGTSFLVIINLYLFELVKLIVPLDRIGPCAVPDSSPTPPSALI